MVLYTCPDESSSRLDERAYNAELDRLTAQLEKYREIICQQEQLIQVEFSIAKSVILIVLM